MKERQLMKGAAFMLLAATATPPAHAQLKTNAGVQYLLSQSKDMSQDFLDLSNTYFFADSLVSFDTSTGKGTVQWKRQQLMPRQAFNANTYLHQPLQSLDFPETAYDNNPQLTFTVEPVSERTLRIRMLTSPIVPKEDADDPMLIGKPADGRSFWKAEKTDKGTLYTSRYGSLLIQNYPWRLVLKDADGRLLTQTRCWSDNDSTQVKVPPFSFIKRGSDNSRSINPVFSLAPNEKIYGCGESATALNKAGRRSTSLSPTRRPRNPGHVQAHPLLLQQPWLRHVHTHFRPRDLRLRLFLHRSHQTLHGRRSDGHLHLPRFAEGDAERIHRTGRTARNAPLVELRHLDEPHHLLQRSRGPRRSPETA